MSPEFLPANSTWELTARTLQTSPRQSFSIRISDERTDDDQIMIQIGVAFPSANTLTITTRKGDRTFHCMSTITKNEEFYSKKDRRIDQEKQLKTDGEGCK